MKLKKIYLLIALVTFLVNCASEDQNTKIHNDQGEKVSGHSTKTTPLAMDAYKDVCENNLEGAPKLYTSLLRKKISNEVAIELGFKDIESLLLKSKKDKILYFKYVRALEAKALLLLDIKPNDFVFEVSKIQKSLIQALAKIKNEHYKNIFIQKVKFLDFKFQSQVLFEEDRDSHHWRRFNDICQIDGLAASAIYIQKNFVLCPGMLIRYATEFGETAGLWNLLQVSAHEMGHGVSVLDQDTKNYFQKFTKCIESNYNDTSNFPSSTGYNITYADETIADIWSLQAIAQRVSKLKITKAEKRTIIKQAFGSYCGYSGDPIHPTGEFSIFAALLNNKSMRELFHWKKPENSCYIN